MFNECPIGGKFTGYLDKIGSNYLRETVSKSGCGLGKELSDLEF